MKHANEMRAWSLPAQAGRVAFALALPGYHHTRRPILACWVRELWAATLTRIVMRPVRRAA